MSIPKVQEEILEDVLVLSLEELHKKHSVDRMWLLNAEYIFADEWNEFKDAYIQMSVQTRTFTELKMAFVQTFYELYRKKNLKKLSKVDKIVEACQR
jgi:hypothetical protein